MNLDRVASPTPAVLGYGKGLRGAMNGLCTEQVMDSVDSNRSRLAMILEAG